MIFPSIMLVYKKLAHTGFTIFAGQRFHYKLCHVKPFIRQCFRRHVNAWGGREATWNMKLDNVTKYIPMY